MQSVDALASRPVTVTRPTNVGQLRDQGGHRSPELPLHILHRGRRVLHGVVQPGRCDHLIVVDHLPDQVGHRLEMHVIGLIGVFSPLVDARMGLGGIFNGACYQVSHESAD